ncbi:MAG: hypothetical protein H6987_18045 [Pseudomonadales bacterium]|nr:hypothetical protein [Pseudomonadales bacterium]
MQTRRNWLALVIATSILAATDYSKALDVAADVVEIQREDASEYGIIVEESKTDFACSDFFIRLPRAYLEADLSAVNLINYSKCEVTLNVGLQLHREKLGDGEKSDLPWVQFCIFPEAGMKTTAVASYSKGDVVTRIIDIDILGELSECH